MTLAYADVGVDVGIEAKAARILYDASRKTWRNRLGALGEIVIPFDDFSGLRYCRVDRLPEGTVMSGGSDGIATKAEIIEHTNAYATAAFDLLAMVCDDAVVRGAEPIIVKSVLDVNTLGTTEERLVFIEQLADGYVRAADAASVVVLNGEIAQLNDRMPASDRFQFGWSADVTWFGHVSRLLSGKDVQPGDAIVALQETGFRCNGLSLVRRIISEYPGELDLRLVAAPSRIYTPAVVAMTGGWNLEREPLVVVHGAAHITGGGIPEKLGRALRPSGYGANLTDLFPPCATMTHCIQIGNIDEDEAYRTWNMGNGMLLITPDPDSVIRVASSFGITAQLAGIVQQEPGIYIHDHYYPPS